MDGGNEGVVRVEGTDSPMVKQGLLGLNDLTPVQLSNITNEEIELLLTRNDARRANLLKHLLVKAWVVEEQAKLRTAGNNEKPFSMRFICGRLESVLNPAGSDGIRGTNLTCLTAVCKSPQSNKRVDDTM